MCFVVVLVLVGVAGYGCGPSAFLIRPVPAKQDLKERTIQKDEGLFIFDKIAVIDVDGVMMNQRRSGLFGGGENPVSIFVEKLDKACNDKNVKAVVLRLNTPGGSVSASDQMYHALKKFKQKSHKPVISSMLGVTASGGYYLACGSDGIVAQPSSVTGSIGTIMQTISLKGTMDKLGIKSVAIKSGALKDMASPLKDLKAEEEIVLKEIITQLYEQFLKVVLEGRKGLKEQKLRELADGRVYTAKQALENKLIDRIGYPDDAIKWAKKVAHIEKAKVVIYHRPIDYKPNVYGTAMSPVEAGALVNVELPGWLKAQGPQFLYLWQPELD